MATMPNGMTTGSGEVQEHEASDYASPLKADDDYAFPRADETYVQGNNGMTLRDYFAAKAMDRMIPLCEDADGGWDYDTVARGCYNLADAMLRARKD